jgi:hypothetical protein
MRRRRYNPTTMSKQQPVGTQRRGRRRAVSRGRTTPPVGQASLKGLKGLKALKGLDGNPNSLKAALAKRMGIGSGTRKIKKPVSTTRGRTIPAAQQGLQKVFSRRARRPSKQQPIRNQPSLGTGAMGFFDKGGKIKNDVCARPTGRGKGAARSV